MGSHRAGSLLLLAAGLAACSERAAPVPAGGPPRHVVVSGTPFEMGEQQGKALKAEIQEAAGPRLRATLRAAATRAEATPEFLEAACRAYATGMKAFLPESVVAELRGLAAGSGVPADDLFLLDVLREGLRSHGKSPRTLEAAFASPPGPAPLATTPGHSFHPKELVSIAVAYEGFLDDAVDGRLVVVERRPKSYGRATAVLTWPGSLGALAGVSGSLLVAQGEVDLYELRRSLKGPPFAIGLRTALERADTIEEFWERLPKLSGNRVIVADDSGNRRLGLVAYAGDPPADSPETSWVLAPAGPIEAANPRGESQEARLGAYPTRPGAEDAVTLALSGRTRGASGPVVRLGFAGLEWFAPAAGTSSPEPVRYAFDPAR